MTKRDAARMGKRSAGIASRSTYRHRGQRAHAAPALSTLAVLIGSMLSGGAQANPSGGQVVAGTASIDHGPNTVNINQASDKAIINWQQFGIKSGETVNFNQPGSQSVTLNRVVGNDPSAIYGSLNANGTVMLVNPNGIVFGAGSRIDVGGLVATTANIRDDDFMAGRYRFAQASAKPGVQVINEGQISIKDSGLAALVAPAVRNTGVIQAKLGKVALAGANSFTLDFQGDGLLSFDAGSVVDQLPRDASGKPVALVENSGKIQADGGTVLLTASAVKSVVDNVINTTGIISATSVGSQNGKIVLSGGQAGGVAVDGTLNASGAAAGQQGGKIVVTGQHVAVAGQALLDVSGSAGGGEIALGSLGAAPDNGAAAFSGKSSSVTVAAGARLKADALAQGKGGTVTLWSEDATVHAGAISARGGEQGGDGGFAEVSSNKNIGLTGTADLRAPKGKTGLLLIDPTTLTIIDANIDGGDQDGNAGSGTLNANAGNTANNTVSRGLLESLAGSANIKLEATGLITVNAMAGKLIDLKTTPGHSFTLRSTERDGIRFIDPQTEIRTQGGNITLEALGQGSTLDNIGKLSSNGGDITLTATSNIRLAGDLNAGMGAVTVQSDSGSIRNSAADARPLLTGDTVTLSARLGDVGAAASALRTDTDKLSLTTGGDLFVGNQATLRRLAIASGHANSSVNNSYQISSTGLAFNLIDGSSYALNTIAQEGLDFLFTGDRGLNIGTIDTGSTGSVALTSTAGGLHAQSGSSLITADAVMLAASGGNGSYTIGESGRTLNTAVNTLKAEAGSIYIRQHGAVTLDGLSGLSTYGQVQLTATAGDISLSAGSILDAGTGTLLLNAQAGSIFDNGGSALRGQSIDLTARNHLGTTDRRINTVTSSLTVNSGGDIYIDNGQKTLTSLNIGNTHAAGQEQNTIQIASPHLGFDVQDDGSAYQLKQLYSASLAALSFTGDRSLVLGSIKANGPVSLTSSLGEIRDDDLADTRVAGNSIVLTAYQGSIGTPGRAVETDTSSLTLGSGGNVHVDSISDLSSLNITHRHALSPSGDYTLQVRAPSLTFDIKDEAADGYRINEVRDSYLNFSFNGDRSMTVGSIDAGHSGTIGLTAQGSASAILDDEDNTTLLLANSVSLSAGGNIGQAGENKHLDIQTSSLQARAESGGVYVQLPRPGGSSNYTGIVNLGEIYAGAGPVEIEALQGDLNQYYGSITSAGDVTLKADHGSIRNQDGYGSITAMNGGTVTLTAGNGGIGDAVNAVRLGGNARIKARASGDIHLRSDDYGIESVTLAEIDAGGSFGYRQNYGTTILGDIQGGDAISIVNEYGDGLRDDGDPDTAVVSTGLGGASSITLSAAFGSIGTHESAVAVNAPDLGLTSGGSINLTNAQAFQRLDITQTGYRDYDASYQLLSSGGQNFDISRSDGATHLNAISAGTGRDLDFGFTAYSGGIVVGQIEAGAQGVVRLDSQGSNIIGQDATHRIAAKTVTLSAGQSLGDGSGEESAALKLAGTEYLTLTAGRDIYVNSDTALKGLDITSKNSSVSTGSASRFGISAQGQAYALSDSGTTQHIGTVRGTGLNFSFSGQKNIEVDDIDVGAGTVTLATSGGGANSNISSKAGSAHRVIAQTVDVSAIGAGATGTVGAIGSSSEVLRLATSNLKLNSNGSVFIDNNNQKLDSVDLYLSRRNAYSETPVNNSYSFSRLSADQSLSISNVSSGSQTINAALNGTDLTVNTDAGITVGAINTGAGSVSLTSRYASNYFAPTIRNLNGSSQITAGRISLDASGRDGSIGAASAAIRTVTTDLSLASAGNVYVANTGTLTDLSLRALHNSSSGSVANTYNISSSGLTFNVTDSIGSPGGLLLTNISAANGLNLAIASDRALTVDNISTGAGGSVTLDTNNTIYGVSTDADQPDISTGDLTLKASTVRGKYNSPSNEPLYVSVNTLSSNVGSSLRVSNNKTLTLLDNRSGGTASVATTAGSILQGSGSRYVAPVLELKAQESIGAAGDALLTDTQRLSTKTGQDLYVDNGSDLFSLNIDSRHNGAGENTLQVQASGLDLDIEDTGSGYNVHRLADDTGIDFTLSTDTNVNVGVLNAGAGRNISLTAASTSVNASIANIDGNAHITAGTVSLWANQNIGGHDNKIHTAAYGLSLRAGGDMAVHNDLDLASLALEISGATVPADRQYDISATGLEFDVGQGHAETAIKVNNVVDHSGLNFSVLSHQLDQHIGTIDVSPQGTVTLSNNAGSLVGQAGNSITASHIALQTLSHNQNDTIGRDVALNLSAPKLSITNSGSVQVVSDMHLDALSIDSRGNGARDYAISSVSRNGDESWRFNASDDGGSLFLEDIQDTAGMALTINSSRGITVGNIDLGGLDNVSLTARSGNIVNDGDDSTLVHAANLSMTAQNGAIGADGNAIDTQVDGLSANSRGGVHLALNDHTRLNGITAYGDSSITNSRGDIALGTINLNGNGLSVLNNGGSILSGTLNDTTSVILKAAGSIGNASALSIRAYGNGTTTLRAEAHANDRGALGSIALRESYSLKAENVSADGDITLTAGGNAGSNLSIGSIQSGHGDVSLTSTYGNISAINSSNAIKGNSVSLTAKYGSGRSIGSDGTRLNIDAPSLTIATPGSFYINNAADMSDLRILRQTSTTGGSGGSMSLNGVGGFSFTATDSGNTTTLATLSDTSGLNFEYSAIGAIRVGRIDVASGSVTLSTSPVAGTVGSISKSSDSSLITADALKVSANGAYNGQSPHINLNTKVGRIEASTGSSGDITLVQNGSLTLDRISSTGNVSVTAVSGDLLARGNELKAGAGKTLKLDAASGHILSEGGTVAGTGALTLSAAHGIGTQEEALQISSSGGTVSAAVTGDGSLYLHHDGTLSGGLTTVVKNGATHVESTGGITLTSMTSTTDSVGNDIAVQSNGNINVGSITAGASHGQATLTANNGSIIAANANAALSAHGISLAGNSIGSSSFAVGATGQDVKATARSGAIYLKTAGDSTYTDLSGYGININAQGKLNLVQADSRNNNITVVNNTGATGLTVGSLNAGSGQVSLSTSGKILDDGDAATRMAAAAATLSAGTGIGSAEHAVQTSTASLSASTSGAGNIYLDDNRSAGVALNNISANNGAIRIKTAGDTVAAQVQSVTSHANNDIAIDAGGNLSIGTINARSLGDVTLAAAGAIIGNSGSLVTARSLSATAGNGIGIVTDTASGAGTPLYVDVSAIDRLASSAEDSIISIANRSAGKLTLANDVIDLGQGGSAYISAAGDMDIGAGMGADVDGHLWLQSGNILTIADAGISTSGTLTLIGASDIVSGGGTARTVTANAGTLAFSSGSAGGDTTLRTTAAHLDASLTGASEADLNVVHDADTLNAKLLTRNGDIAVETSGLLNAISAQSSTDHHTISLTSNQNDIQLGSINAGDNGKIVLHARNGALQMGDETSLVARELDLISHTAIGSAEHRFSTAASLVSAEVTGTGGIYLEGTYRWGLGLGRIATADGDIDISATNDLFSGTGLSTGNGGHISLRSETGYIGLYHGLDLDNGSNVSLQAGGQVVIAGDVILAGTEGANLEISTASGMDINLLGSVTTAGAQDYHADTTLLFANLSAGDSITFDGDVDLQGSHCRCLLRDVAALDTIEISTTDGDISIGGALDGGGRAANLQARAGNATISGNAGNLSSLDITAQNISLASVTTDGGQYYRGDTTLAGDYNAGDYSGFLVEGLTTLAGNTTVSATNSHVRFDGGVHGPFDLAIAANGGDGSIDIGGEVGNTDTRLGSLTLGSGNGTTFNGPVYAGSVYANGAVTVAGGRVDTVGTQTYNDRLHVRYDTTLAGTDITLAGGAAVWTPPALGRVPSDAISVPSLAIAGNADIAGDIGSADQALAAFSVSGTTVLHGNNVYTTGAQTYDGQLQLHGDTTLAGSTITLAQGAMVGAPIYARMLFTPPPAAASLTIAGDADITGDIGSAEHALTAFSVSGDATLHGNHIHTTGHQSYAGAVALAGSQAMTSTGGDIWFGGTLSGSHDLAVQADAGAVYFSDVGNDGAGRLGDLTLASADGTVFSGAMYAESITADGTVAVSGGRVDTTGAQTYNGQLRLQQDATLAGTTIALKDGAVAWAPVPTLVPAAAPSLAITGNADITGHIGAAEQALGAFSVSGTTAMNSGNVYTTGAQYYGGHAALGGDTSLNGSLVTLARGADSNMAPGSNAALTINGDASLAGNIGKNVALSSLTVNGAATLGAGSIATVHDQTFEGATILSDNQRLASLDGDIQFHDTLSGGHDLAIQSRTGSARFNAAVGSGAAGRLGNLALDTANGALFNGPVHAHSVHVDGNARVAGGLVDATGTQTYNGQLQLQHDATLAGTTITLKQGAVAAMPMLMRMPADAAAAPSLTIDGNADITGDIGTIGQALASFTVGGTTALRQSNVYTTGAQNYAGHVVLHGDTNLNGSLITLAGGADSATGAGAALAIHGDASLAGDIGKAQALTSLNVQGNTTLGEGSITTLGQQAYQGPVTLKGHQALRSQQAGIAFADTLSSANLANLSLNAADSINVQGKATGLGDLTLSARNTIVFNDTLSAYRIVQLESGSSTYRGTVTALGEGGIAMTGGDFTFDQAVTASTGAIALNNKATSTLKFAQDGAISAATGFTQTGGGALQLPASLQVAKGPISISALASLPSGAASIKTDGAITIAGLYGPDTRLTMASGSGAQTIGLNNGDTRYKINVAELIVPNAASAMMFGTVAGYANAQAAQHITSALVGPPYYINGTPWGPVTSDTINRITSVTAPQTIVPSTPGADSLFRLTVQPEGVSPDALAPYRDPQVLTLAQFDSTLLQGEPDAGQNDRSDNAGTEQSNKASN